MTTLKQLRRENRRLKNVREGLRDIEEIQKQRMNLLRENKQLARNIKGTGKKSGFLLKVGKTFGRGSAKAGKSAFRGLERYANFLQEQERKQKLLNRKLKSVRGRKK